MHRNPKLLLDQMLSYHTCMHRCTTCHNRNTLAILKYCIINSILCEIRKFLIDTWCNRIADCIRLLIDFLEHEEWVTTLLCTCDIPVYSQHLWGYFVSLQILNINTILFECQNVILRYYEILLRELDQRSQIGSDNRTSLTGRCNHRADIPNRVDCIRDILEHNTKCKCTGKYLHCLLDCLDRITLIELIQKCSNDLRICL